MCSIESLWGEFQMAHQDLSATSRGLAVIVAIALVATAMAPLIMAAVRVVA
jgi:hypothetical protein